MKNYGLTFHHFGLAARNPDKTIRWLTSLGYKIGPAVRDDLQNVNLVLCTSPTMPAIEVISETETSGPLASFLNFQPAMIYHVCYETRDLAETLSAVERDNHWLRTLSEPKPSVLFSGRHVSFYHIDGFGIIEILEAR